MKIAKICAIAGLLAAIALPGLALEPKSSCAALAAWASQLEKLPADYESFTALDFDRRLAVYQKLSDAERAALWQRHLQEALTQEGWSEGQRDLIADAQELVTADKLAAMRPPRTGADSAVAQAAFDELKEKAEGLFPQKQVFELFYDLGSKEPVGGKYLIPPSTACSCSVFDYYCPPGRGSCSTQNCDYGNGCGFFGNQTCDGKCVGGYPPPWP